MGNKIDWIRTHHNVVKYLSTKKKPVNYRELFDNCVEYCLENYSDGTIPLEKFRQYYDDTDRDGVLFIPGGTIALKRWFPNKAQLPLFAPLPHPEILRGNCIVSYDTGYEQALRQQHMVDHFNDANSIYRIERRRRAALVESHIKHYFLTHYPTFYIPPSNDKQYNKPSVDDFGLKFLRYPTILVDVKTWTENNNGDKSGVIRRIKPNVLYLWGDWVDDDSVQIDGFEFGAWLSQFGITNENLTFVRNKWLFETEILLVILNMALDGIDYSELKKKIFSKGAI